MDIDGFRKGYLALSELLDAFRLVPRVLIGLYCYTLYKVVQWYMDLHPYMLDKCTSQTITDCIVHAPTTQHAALVTAVVSIAAAIFGMYAATGRKWNGFTSWKKSKETKEEKPTESEVSN